MEKDPGRVETRILREPGVVRQSDCAEF